MTSESSIEAFPFFLQGSTGKLFALYFPPSGDAALNRTVLYFPPFAEEANKSRRIVALQARALASQGVAALLIDPFGTADSEGDFAEARWELWRDDLQRAVQWLREQGTERLIFWGLRLGALLAVDLAVTLGQVERLILWQPVIRGEVFMTQFLRLHLAADMAGGAARLTTRDLRASLNAGNLLEIAGYMLAPELVAAVDRLSLQDADSAKMPRIDWIDIVGDVEQPTSAAGQRLLKQWRATGVQAVSHTVAGEPFWSTPEITVVPALLNVMTELLAGDRT